MKIIQNCQNCDAKNSLLIIFNRENYYKKGSWSHKDKTSYYICKKCGYHQKFNTNDIISNAGIFFAFFVSDEDVKKMKNMQNSCIFCDSISKPPYPAKNELSEHAVLKLFVKPKKRFLGYFCKVCRRAYYIPNRIMKWEKSNFFEKGKKVDLLNPLTGQLPMGIKEKHTKWNPTRKLIIDIRYLDCIGNFVTSEGFPIGETDRQTITIQVPKTKIKHLRKYLEKHKILIVR